MHQRTRDTYDQSAQSLSQHYDEIGARDGDVELAFALAGNPENAVVLELGCGNGRDARAILRRTPFYTGIDTSKKMIAIATQKVPKGDFKVADAITHNYGGPYDIIFAFALFRHLEINEVTAVLRKAAASLKEGGILYISSMFGRVYEHHAHTDNYGTREMHLYNPEIILKHCPPSLKKVQEIYDHIDGNEWFELALRKK